MTDFEIIMFLVAVIVAINLIYESIRLIICKRKRDKLFLFDFSSLLCAECKRNLTADEIEHYDGNCEDCESKIDYE